MRLKCSICDNQARFEGEARARVRVVIDGQGRMTGERVERQIFEDVMVLRAITCKSCGASGKVIDLDAVGANGGGSSEGRQNPYPAG